MHVYWDEMCSLFNKFVVNEPFICTTLPFDNNSKDYDSKENMITIQIRIIMIKYLFPHLSKENMITS